MSTETEPSIDWIKYLRLYVAEIEWSPHLNQLANRIKDQNIRHNQAACAVLLPYRDKSVLTNPPQNLLFWVGKYTQIDDCDWVAELKRISKRDEEYDSFKDELLGLGIIDPIEFNPTTRQAYNWLIEQAKYSLGECGDDTIKRMKNLVYIYGGNVICSVFQKPEWQKKVRNLHNWRTGYFFRNLIHEIYPNKEDIKKIKAMEIKRLNQAGSTLVRTIKKEE